MKISENAYQPKTSKKERKEAAKTNLLCLVSLLHASLTTNRVFSYSQKQSTSLQNGRADRLHELTLSSIQKLALFSFWIFTNRIQPSNTFPQIDKAVSRMIWWASLCEIQAGARKSEPLFDPCGILRICEVLIFCFEFPERFWGTLYVPCCSKDPVCI